MTQNIFLDFFFLIFRELDLHFKLLPILSFLVWGVISFLIFWKSYIYLRSSFWTSGLFKVFQIWCLKLEMLMTSEALIAVQCVVLLSVPWFMCFAMQLMTSLLTLSWSGLQLLHWKLGVFFSFDTSASLAVTWRLCSWFLPQWAGYDNIVLVRTMRRQKQS